MSTKSKEVGANIRRLRKEKGLRQTDVAEMLGMTSQAVSSWEIGRTEPSIADVQRLSKIFGCSTSQILGSYRELMEIDAYMDDPQLRRLFLYVCHLLPRDPGKRDAQIKGIMAALAAMREADNV